ncbi:MAG: long-chain fatty acid--CoA ligase [Gammaproteobacteria bacterium]|nr:long-chain fatty acid--CoA ligase [Gammaproteobacteria bacterium]
MTNSIKQDVIDLDEAGNLHGLLLERVRRSPDAIAYRYYHQDTWLELTWQQFANDVARWKEALCQEGLSEGDAIAIMVPNCPQWIMLEQAALSLGIIVVPLYINDRAENVAYIIKDAGVKLLLIEHKSHWDELCDIYKELENIIRIVTLEKIEVIHDDRVILADDWLPDTATPLTSVNIDRDSLATIVYTSGTTGHPKGVMLSHYNILWNAHSSQRCEDFYPSDRFLSFLPLSHMFERTAGYYMVMIVGAQISFARSIEKLAKDMLTVRPTVLVTVPRIFERVYNKIQMQLEQKPKLAAKLFIQTVNTGWQCFLNKQGKSGWKFHQLLWPLLDRMVAGKIRARLGGKLRLAISGGAPLSPDIARTFIGLGIEISQGYGMTELSPVVSTNLLKDNDPFSVGQPLSDVEVKLGDDKELLVRSPGVMLGYYNQDKATQDIIDSDGWLHTGDVADIRNNHIYITGRIKDILVLANGEKIPPSDMELAICNDPLFEQAIVVGEGRSFLGVITVLNPDKWKWLAGQLNINISDPLALDNDLVSEKLLEIIADKLSGFPGYAKVYKVKALLDPWTIENNMITPTMKLKRTQILAKYHDVIEQFYQGH